MSKSTDEAGQDKPTKENVKSVDKAPTSKKSDSKADELEEGLNESFPGSDAPASTRRSEH